MSTTLAWCWLAALVVPMIIGSVVAMIQHFGVLADPQRRSRWLRDLHRNARRTGDTYAVAGAAEDMVLVREVIDSERFERSSRAAHGEIISDRNAK